MTEYTPYEEIQKHIAENPKNLPHIHEIRLEIWETGVDQIVITMSLIYRDPEHKHLKMSDYDSFSIASCSPSCDDVAGFKQYGQKLKAKLARDYKYKKITSDLHYR